jgi:putative DNA primase/helicase
LADTLRPRLEAAGANLDHVTAMDITAEGEHTGTFALDRDLPALEQAIDELGDCRLVVIDPISLSLGRSHENANVAVRTLLAPLIALATVKHVAIVAVTHLNKSLTQRALHRSMGSMAFVSAARSAWLVMADPADRSRRLLLNMKSNLSGEKTGLAYRIEDCEGQAARVVWEPGEVTETPDQLLARVAVKEAADESIVTEWLQGRLDTTPTSADSILRAADNLGFSTNQVFKASQKLGVQKVKLGYCLGWEWSLPRENKNKA